MFSDKLLAGLKKVGYADPGKGPVDWLRAVSEGEYAHPYYSLRRVWRVFDRVNPDLGLSPWVSGGGYTTDYPFSVAPRAKLTREDVIGLYRDHYEGTQFDLTKGVAAGPYGDPNRYIGPYDGAQNNVSQEKLYGAWERAISIFYQGYTYVAQTRPDAPELTRGMLWYGPDVAYTSCFVPFPSKATQLPHNYQIGDPQRFSRDAAWWAFDFVANWARLNYQRMCQVDILPLQREIEAGQAKVVEEWDRQCAEGCTAITLTRMCEQNAVQVVEAWWALADRLIARYSDGYINLPGTQGQPPAPVPVGYPSQWLGLTDYRDGPLSYDMK